MIKKYIYWILKWTIIYSLLTISILNIATALPETLRFPTANGNIDLNTSGIFNTYIGCDRITGAVSNLCTVTGGAGSYNLNVTTDSGNIVIEDNELLTITGGTGISTSATGNTITITNTGGSGSDTTLNLNTSQFYNNSGTHTLLLSWLAQFVNDNAPVGGGGGTGDKWIDGGTYIYPNSTFAPNIKVFGSIEANDWTNATITTSQITDYTTNTGLQNGTSETALLGQIYLQEETTSDALLVITQNDITSVYPAININNRNTLQSGLWYTGNETSHGGIKTKHIRPITDDSSASHISMIMQDNPVTKQAPLGDFIFANGENFTGDYIQFQNNTHLHYQLTHDGRTIIRSNNYYSLDMQFANQTKYIRFSGVDGNAYFTNTVQAREFEMSGDIIWYDDTDTFIQKSTNQLNFVMANSNRMTLNSAGIQVLNGNLDLNYNNIYEINRLNSTEATINNQTWQNNVYQYYEGNCLITVVGTTRDNICT